MRNVPEFSPEHFSFARRLVGAIECGEVEVTPEEMHYLNGLADWEFDQLITEAAESLDVILLPFAKPPSVRVKVVRR